jgi:hypothetical protein
MEGEIVMTEDGKVALRNCDGFVPVGLYYIFSREII